MAKSNTSIHVYVGLAGEGETIGAGGLLRHVVGSDQWVDITKGLPDRPQIRALLVNPDDGALLYAGTQKGVYSSDDHGETWNLLHCPSEGTDVWSLAFHPTNPKVIYAGYEPCAIYRSLNGGKSWGKMDTTRVIFPDVTTYMSPLVKRVIGIAADPSNPSDVYAAVEVGGLLHSRDAGDTWDSSTDGLYTENHTVDLHGVTVSSAAPGNIFIIGQVAMFRSPDKGAHWKHIRFGEMFPGGAYCRDLAIAPDDPMTLYVAAGAGGGGAPNGTVEAGALFRSRDLGDNWERLDIGEIPSSRMFQVAISNDQPNKIFCCTKDGHFFNSDDRGDTWSSSRIPINTSRSLHVYPMVCG